MWHCNLHSRTRESLCNISRSCYKLAAPHFKQILISKWGLRLYLIHKPGFSFSKMYLSTTVGCPLHWHYINLIHIWQIISSERINTGLNEEWSFRVEVSRHMAVSPDSWPILGFGFAKAHRSRQAGVQLGSKVKVQPATPVAFSVLMDYLCFAVLWQQLAHRRRCDSPLLPLVNLYLIICQR